MLRYIFTLCFSLLVLMAIAQPCGGLRYQQRVFAQTVKTKNVVYGNAPSLPAVYLSENVTQNIDLKLDVWQPAGDTLQRRPLVILAFGGAFLIGSKEDEDMRTIADSLAHRGYVTASINYRLGMNVVDAVSAERAIYRGMQDYSAAVRYFKEFADQYRIDTNYIYAGGVSAGGFSALHMALVDESDRPASSFSASGFNPRPDLGCKDCSGNSYAHSSNVRGLISYWGAIGDVNWIKPGKAMPLLSIHGDQDLIVPYNTGYPFTALAVLPQVSGSGAIKQRYDQIGAYNLHYRIAGEGHNTWGPIILNEFTPGPNQYFQPFYGYTADFLFDLTRPERPKAQGDDTVCTGVLVNYSVHNQPGVSFCWQIDGGQIISNNGARIQVLWQRPGVGELYVFATNHLDAESIKDTLEAWVNIPEQAHIIAPNGGSVCSQSPLTLFSSTAASFYEWTPQNYFSDPIADTTVLTPLISGLYYLITTDSNNCRTRDSIYITVLAPPLLPVVGQEGDSLYVISSGGTIKWYDADSNLVFTGDGFVPQADGGYYAVETAINGCESVSSTYLYIGTGIGSIQSSISVYPNPFQDVLTVKEVDNGTWTLYNATGAILMQQQISGAHNIPLPNLSNGIYFYTIYTHMGKVCGKLVKW